MATRIILDEQQPVGSGQWKETGKRIIFGPVDSKEGSDGLTFYDPETNIAALIIENAVEMQRVGIVTVSLGRALDDATMKLNNAMAISMITAMKDDYLGSLPSKIRGNRWNVRHQTGKNIPDDRSIIDVKKGFVPYLVK